MPCYDHRNSPDYIHAEYKGRIDQMARWLCQLLGALEKMGINMAEHDPELAKWWAEHKAFDEKRK